MLREVGAEETLSQPDSVVAVEWPSEVLFDWTPDEVRLCRTQLTVNENDSPTTSILPSS